MQRLRPISAPPSPPPSPDEKSTEPMLDVKLSTLRLPAISAPPVPEPQSTLSSLPSASWRILDFDLETVAAGFADPDWVPQKITCAAWSWVGCDDVHVRVCGPEGIFGDPGARVRMLEPLLEAIRQADVVTGHNLLRFDLPVLNAECLRLNLPTLPSLLVQDTMRVPRSKGFKKGQDALGRLLKVPGEKLALDWQAWQDAYDEPGWPTVVERASSDVLMHKQLRVEMLRRGWLNLTSWRPGGLPALAVAA